MFSLHRFLYSDLINVKVEVQESEANTVMRRKIKSIFCNCGGVFGSRRGVYYYPCCFLYFLVVRDFVIPYFNVKSEE